MTRIFAAALVLTIGSLSPAAASGPIPNVPTLWPVETAFGKQAQIVSRNAFSIDSAAPEIKHDR